MRAPLRINASHSYVDRGDDDYPTPREAIRALMCIERLPRAILDPCCGTGALLDVLAAGGHAVAGINLTDQGWPGVKVSDYLSAPLDLSGAAIVSNPPIGWRWNSFRKRLLTALSMVLGS